MVNNKKFSKKLKTILDYYEITASGLADKIGVQRSSISHLISGRNKPSLDFVLKILDAFEDVHFDWLVKNIGEFPPTSKTSTSPTLFSQNIENEKKVIKDIDEEKKMESAESSFPIPKSRNNQNLVKVILFYQDGSFEAYDA